MAKKKRTDPKSATTGKPPVRALKKAVPPPDDPLLRHQADQTAHDGGADAEAMARARAEAVRHTREMPVADRDDDIDARDQK